MAFITSFNTIIHIDTKPVLVDINWKTLNIDSTKLESKITKNIKSIFPVHFTLVPIDLDLIYGIAIKYKFSVFEDGTYDVSLY
jgi:dTDP-4-amino-4,6-dideoxygalactose transaminase